MTTLKQFLVYAKAHIALVGLAATWYVATYPSGPDVKYVAAGIALLTYLGVLRVKNAPKVKKAKGKHRATHTVTHRHLPEIKVPGKPLGRHVRHDSRSLDYQVIPDGTVATVRWDRTIPVLDQGSVGSCVGNATTGALGTAPNYPPLAAQIAAGQLHLNETEALTLYSAAEVIDGDGPYPPNDNGSSGLSGAKAAKNAGLISGYTHVTSIAGAQTAIQQGPTIIGASWYTSFDTPRRQRPRSDRQRRHSPRRTRIRVHRLHGRHRSVGDGQLVGYELRCRRSLLHVDRDPQSAPRRPRRHDLVRAHRSRSVSTANPSTCSDACS